LSVSGVAVTVRIITISEDVEDLKVFLFIRMSRREARALMDAAQYVAEWDGRGAPTPEMAEVCSELASEIEEVLEK